MAIARKKHPSIGIGAKPGARFRNPVFPCIDVSYQLPNSHNFLLCILGLLLRPCTRASQRHCTDDNRASDKTHCCPANRPVHSSAPPLVKTRVIYATNAPKQRSPGAPCGWHRCAEESGPAGPKNETNARLGCRFLITCFACYLLSGATGKSRRHIVSTAYDTFNLLIF